MASKKENRSKTGILLVAFGSSITEAQKAYANIGDRVSAAFPGLEVRWGYTSAMVRRKLTQSAQITHSPTAALARMADEGFTHVAVQSLHVIPGLEYHDLLHIARAMQGLPKGLQQISVGLPLLSSHHDMERITQALAGWTDTFRAQHEAVLFMGHGTPHPANIYYPALQYYLQERHPMLFLGTLDGYPSIADAVQKLKAAQTKQVWLVPLMTVAGDHALKDMTGNADQSWENIMQKEGIATQAMLKGLGQIDSMVDIWLDHLKTALGQLQPLATNHD